MLQKVPYYTTLPGILAVTKAIAAQKADTIQVRPLQDYFKWTPLKFAHIWVMLLHTRIKASKALGRVSFFPLLTGNFYGKSTNDVGRPRQDDG